MIFPVAVSGPRFALPLRPRLDGGANCRNDVAQIVRMDVGQALPDAHRLDRRDAPHREHIGRPRDLFVLDVVVDVAGPTDFLRLFEDLAAFQQSGFGAFARRDVERDGDDLFRAGDGVRDDSLAPEQHPIVGFDLDHRRRHAGRLYLSILVGRDGREVRRQDVLRFPADDFALGQAEEIEEEPVDISVGQIAVLDRNRAGDRVHHGPQHQPVVGQGVGNLAEFRDVVADGEDAVDRAGLAAKRDLGHFNDAGPLADHDRHAA